MNRMTFITTSEVIRYSTYVKGGLLMTKYSPYFESVDLSYRLAVKLRRLGHGVIGCLALNEYWSTI
jgi:hypothetical protein